MINKRLINMFHGSKKYILKTVLFKWIALLSSVITIFFIGFLLEEVLNSTASINDILITIFVILIGILIRVGSNIYSSKTSFLASSEVKKTLRDKIYKKLLEFGASYNEKIKTSEAVQVSVEGVEQLEIFFGGYLPQLLYSLVAPITLFIILSFINLRSSLVLLFCVPLIPLSIVGVQKFAKKLLDKYWGTYTQMGDSFLENIEGLTTLKIYQRDKEKSDEMDIEAENFRKITMRVLTMQLNSITVMDLVAFGGAAIGIIVAANEFIKGNISFSGAFAIIMLSAEFFIPLRLLGSFFHIAMNGMAASDKIFNILDMKSPVKGKEKISSGVSFIEFNEVGFSYNEDREVIKDLSFIINKGKVASFVGESGSGKSTISKLIMGINKNYTGNIKINNKELSHISEKSIMDNITLVSSSNYIFKGTIRDNLSMGRENVKDNDMEAALKKVNLYDFVYSQNGLNTLLEEKGSNLSGGQIQRLALARVILKDSSLYIFDEITSNIDMESEKDIINVIYDLSKDKGVILISHRLQNVVHSDTIYVLKNGTLVEKGSHKELFDHGETYKNLYLSQNKLENFASKGEVSYA